MTTEQTIQVAIEEWATIQGGPNPIEGTTLAHYITTKLHKGGAGSWDSYESLAGDMWNELENLRSLWEGTNREVPAEQLIYRYEKLSGV